VVSEEETNLLMVGNKDRKSLAIIIPAQIAKEYSFDTSTIFALKVDNMRRLTLQNVVAVVDEEQPAKQTLSTRSVGADSI
jgi:antitoxin component of MazEF toxin-antitoxin module